MAFPSRPTPTVPVWAAPQAPRCQPSFSIARHLCFLHFINRHSSHHYLLSK